MTRDERVALFAPSLDGHRATYIRHLLQHAPHGSDVFLLTTASSQLTSGFREQVLPYVGVDRVITVLRPELTEAASAFEHFQFRRIIAIDGDGIVPELIRHPWRHGGRLVLLIMRAHAQPRKTYLGGVLVDAARAGTIRAVSRMPRVDVTTLVAPYQGGRARFGPPVVDPVEISEEGRERGVGRAHFSLDPSVRWIGVVGAVTARKRPDLVVETAAALGATGVLFAGPVSAEVATWVHGAKEGGSPVVMKNSYLTDREIDLAVASLDVLIVAHTNRGPSGILAKAMAIGTPAVVTGPREMRDVARRWRGVAYAREATPEAFVHAVRDVWDEQLTPGGFAQESGPRQFAESLYS